ncbi:hypothetical protein [Nubsella zeaxanthinifaciens]|uniref:hypothetical protein n=1 Tax=Nubsella zeaxanthinifaciens TaxID=392412 RepID=UPI0013009271|nr:hypothetical protein [Nubsella zeaxanthinifaciens]
MSEQLQIQMKINKKILVFIAISGFFGLSLCRYPEKRDVNTNKGFDKLKSRGKILDSSYMWIESIPVELNCISGELFVERTSEKASQQFGDSCNYIVRKLRILYTYKGKKLRNNRNRCFTSNVFSDATGLIALYSFDKRNTLGLTSKFSSVKYNGEYYIVGFPEYEDWDGFMPPEKDGYFLYTPVAFHLDTAEHKLTYLKYNTKMEIPKKSNVMIYTNTKYNFEWDRDFAFSISKKEFVFGKTKGND